MVRGGLIMEKWKDITQYSTAVAALCSGIVLAFFQYFEITDLTNGMLGYVAQVLLYAAGIFGVTMYWNGKYGELANYIRVRDSEIRKLLKDDEKIANKISK